MLVVRALMAAVVLAGLACAQNHVSFPTPDGWTIHADLYGMGDRCVVLVHGGRFEKGSWEKQARALVKAGFCALAIDLRGFGLSRKGRSRRVLILDRRSTCWRRSVTFTRRGRKRLRW